MRIGAGVVCWQDGEECLRATDLRPPGRRELPVHSPLPVEPVPVGALPWPGFPCNIVPATKIKGGDAVLTSIDEITQWLRDRGHGSVAAELVQAFAAPEAAP